jgi:hypothetical protein
MPEPRGPLAYFGLGTDGIRLRFDRASILKEAREQIVLADHFEGNLIGEVRFVEDRSVEQRVDVECPVNVIYNREFDLGDGRRAMHLKMFNEHAFIVETCGPEVIVRFSRGSPVRLLVDDVFHVGLQHLLESLSGFILHGACVAREGKAIVFMGRSGAGKSSTAFNLTRFGFQGYADDATIVTLKNGRLWTWPLSRELSIRPLTFSLFAEQGIALKRYTQDEGKFYFSGHNAESGAGVPLEHICFVEISGEEHTEVTRLSPQQTLERLLEEERNFSFMARSSAPRYSAELARNVPSPLLASVGMDLERQGRVLADVVLERDPSGSAYPAVSLGLATRRQKLALVRRAWAEPTPDDLAQLIPLLADVDPKVLALAFTSLQTLPLAQLEPLVGVPSDNGAPQSFGAPWLHAKAWLAGCRELIRRSGVEVLRQFAYSWIKSAPLLYPFLAVAATHETAKLEQVEDAWIRHAALREPGEECSSKLIEVHVADFGAQPAWSDPALRSWWADSFSAGDETAHVHFWVTATDMEGWDEILRLLETAQKTPRLTIAPVAAAGQDLSSAIALTRFARARGTAARISRTSPLCRIDEDASRELLATGALETAIPELPARRFQHFSSAAPREQPPDAPLEEITWPEAGVAWSSGGELPCSTCGLKPLGLCRGGFAREGAPR